MPVIINEFEIITAPPEPSTERPETEPRPAPPAPLRPAEIEQIVRRHQMRLARVRAD
jgi:hypothetical protein